MSRSRPATRDCSLVVAADIAGSPVAGILASAEGIRAADILAAGSLVVDSLEVAVDNPAAAADSPAVVADNPGAAAEQEPAVAVAAEEPASPRQVQV